MKQNENTGQANGHWIGVGGALGVAFGAAFDSIGIGLALGVAIGAALDIPPRASAKESDE